MPRALGPSGRRTPAHPVTVAELTRAMLEALGAPPLFGVEPATGSLEMRSLAVDAARAQGELGWRNRLPSAAAIGWTASWHSRVRRGDSPRAVTLDQIDAYCAVEISQ